MNRPLFFPYDLLTAAMQFPLESSEMIRQLPYSVPLLWNLRVPQRYRTKRLQGIELFLFFMRLLKFPQLTSRVHIDARAPPDPHHAFVSRTEPGLSNAKTRLDHGAGKDFFPSPWPAQSSFRWSRSHFLRVFHATFRIIESSPSDGAVFLS